MLGGGEGLIGGEGEKRDAACDEGPSEGRELGGGKLNSGGRLEAAVGCWCL